MTQQFNIPNVDDLHPERTEPPLWIRRLVVLKDPDNRSDSQNLIRDIKLQLGMNIVLSPDDAATVTHGSGKSMFCGMLRYVLGEDAFAPKDTLKQVRKKLPNSVVGAEIVIQGKSWIVIRNLRDLDHDIVTTNLTLDAALIAHGTPTGIGPLIDAISQGILGESRKFMPAYLGETEAWEAALAWASRDSDPECFLRCLEWRSKSSESGSLVRRMSREDRSLVVRAMIGALTPEEVSLRKECKDKKSEVDKVKIEISRLTWEIGKGYDKLSAEIGQPPTTALPTNARALIELVDAQLTKVRKLPASSATTLADAIKDRDEAQNDLHRLETGFSEMSVRIEMSEKHLARMRAVLPDIDACLTVDGKAICPACGISMEDALAKGLLPHESNLDNPKSNRDKRDADISEEEEALRNLNARKPRLKEEIDIAERRVKSSNQVVALFDANKKSLRDKEQLLRDAKHLKELFEERSELQASVKANAFPLKNLRGNLTDYRTNYANSANNINHMSSLFHNVVNQFFPGNPEGTIKLEGKELTVAMKLDGIRRTTSVEAMMVIAFDFAALAFEIEGGNSLPGFLIHDSPRISDIGSSIYDRIFEVAHAFEYGRVSKPKGATKLARKPLFQYIISTTSPPPPQFCNGDEFIKLRLHGAPAEQRFLRVDL